MTSPGLTRRIQAAHREQAGLQARLAATLARQAEKECEAAHYRSQAALPTTGQIHRSNLRRADTAERAATAAACKAAEQHERLQQQQARVAALENQQRQASEPAHAPSRRRARRAQAGG